MKKFVSLCLVALLAFAVVPPTSVFARENKDWTEAYSNYLNNVLDDLNDNNKVSRYDVYSITDIDGDHMPELILSSSVNKKDFKLVRFEAGEAKDEKTFNAEAFYLTKADHHLVAEVSTSSGTYYIQYDKDKSFAQSANALYKKRPVASKAVVAENIYFINNKEVKKDVYDKDFNEKLELTSFYFLPITKENNDWVFAGRMMDEERLNFTGIKTGSSTFTQTEITFNTSAKLLTESMGEKKVFALLMVNGELVTDVFPVNVDGNTLIPARVVSENLNAKVNWNPALQRVTIEGSKTVEMYIGNKEAYVNNEKTTLAVPPTIIDGVTYVPARFVAENLSSDIYFLDGNDNFLPIVNIESKGQDEALTEFDAKVKAEYFLDDVAWTKDNFAFTKSYMKKNLLYKYQGLVLGRYHVITVDVNESQVVWVDRYNGKLYSVYEAGNEFGIKLGADGVIDALKAAYIG